MERQRDLGVLHESHIPTFTRRAAFGILAGGAVALLTSSERYEYPNLGRRLEEDEIAQLLSTYHTEVIPSQEIANDGLTYRINVPQNCVPHMRVTGEASQVPFSSSYTYRVINDQGENPYNYRAVTVLHTPDERNVTVQLGSRPNGSWDVQFQKVDTSLPILSDKGIAVEFYYETEPSVVSVVNRFLHAFYSRHDVANLNRNAPIDMHAVPYQDKSDTLNIELHRRNVSQRGRFSTRWRELLDDTRTNGRSGRTLDVERMGFIAIHPSPLTHPEVLKTGAYRVAIHYETVFHVILQVPDEQSIPFITPLLQQISVNFPNSCVRVDGDHPLLITRWSNNVDAPVSAYDPQRPYFQFAISSEDCMQYYAWRELRNNPSPALQKISFDELLKQYGDDVQYDRRFIDFVRTYPAFYPEIARTITQ